MKAPTRRRHEAGQGLNAGKAPQSQAGGRMAVRFSGLGARPCQPEAAPPSALREIGEGGEIPARGRGAIHPGLPTHRATASLREREGDGVVVNSLNFAVHLKSIGRHLSRPKSQHGWLTDVMPKRGKLPRGRFLGRWRVYYRTPEGSEAWRHAEKIIDRSLAETVGFPLDYDGALNKTDARRVLEKLIQESNAAPAAFRSKATFGDLAREYIAMNKPGWDADTARVNEQLIETHLIGKLGDRPVRELADVELQDFMNRYVEAG